MLFKMAMRRLKSYGARLNLNENCLCELLPFKLSANGFGTNAVVAFRVGYAPGAINQSDFQSRFAVDPRSGQIIYSAMIGTLDTNIDLLTLAKRQ